MIYKVFAYWIKIRGVRVEQRNNLTNLYFNVTCVYFTTVMLYAPPPPKIGDQLLQHLIFYI